MPPEALIPPTLPAEVGSLLGDLRRRADEDFAHPGAEHAPGRHRVELPGLGLRVSITRSLYPNRPAGRDLYAVTISRLVPGDPPEEAPTRQLLAATFGAAAAGAEERPAGSAVRVFRVPAARAAQ